MSGVVGHVMLALLVGIYVAVIRGDVPRGLLSSPGTSPPQQRPSGVAVTLAAATLIDQRTVPAVALHFPPAQ